MRSNGPLTAIRVLEIGGIGPLPHAGMLLADLGADILRVERPGGEIDDKRQHLMLRNRDRVELDLKSEAGLGILLGLVESADVLLEGYRPGVAQRLGFGSEECRQINPRLIYASMTGWGQDGPMSAEAGHDINYLSLTGVLSAIGRAGERPVPPLNLVGDYGGGSMLLVIGVLAALLERERSGEGQVLDVAMLDGISLLGQVVWDQLGSGAWNRERGTNVLDGGAPYYDTYECADGKFVAVGAIEPQFFANLIRGLRLDTENLPAQTDQSQWPRLRGLLAGRFATRSRDEWAGHFAGQDACVTPVLTFEECAAHPQIAARRTVISPGGVPQAAPGPRYSRSVLPAPAPSGPLTGELPPGWARSAAS